MQGKHISCLRIYTVKLKKAERKNIYYILKFFFLLIHDMFLTETMRIVSIAMTSKSIAILSQRKNKFFKIKGLTTCRSNKHS